MNPDHDGQVVGCGAGRRPDIETQTVFALRTGHQGNLRAVVREGLGNQDPLPWFGRLGRFPTKIAGRGGGVGNSFVGADSGSATRDPARIDLHNAAQARHRSQRRGRQKHRAQKNLHGKDHDTKLQYAVAWSLEPDALHHRRFPAAQPGGQASLSDFRRRRADLVIIATSPPRASPKTGNSKISSRSGWRAIIISGAHAGQWRRRTLLHGGREPVREIRGVGGHGARTLCEILSIIGRIWSCSATSGSMSSWTSTAPGAYGRGPTSCSRRRAACSRNPEAVSRDGALHHGRPGGRSPCHRAIRASGCAARVFPAFRPDKALTVHLPDVFNTWVDRLAAASNVDIANLQDFTDALRQRHDAFHAMGARLSDHGLNHCHADFCSSIPPRPSSTRRARGNLPASKNTSNSPLT